MLAVARHRQNGLPGLTITCTFEAQTAISSLAALAASTIHSAWVPALQLTARASDTKCSRHGT